VGIALPETARDGIVLATNEPNPFSHGTSVSFSLPAPQVVRLSVHDVTGREVRTLLNGAAGAGVTRRNWDGRDSSGLDVASGVYFFRLETAEGSRSVKGTLRR
jgi:flagellar hook assembly protein FlgD